MRRDFDILNIARKRFDDDIILQKLFTHLLRIGFMLVGLGDRDDHRNASGLHMVYCFDRLGLWPVIGSDNDHDDVGHVRAALTHFGERFMARRIEEGDRRFVLHRHLIGANMLRDPARFFGYDRSAAQHVEQRRFAVIDMAHDRDDWRAGFERFGRVDITGIDFNVRIRHAIDVVAEFGDEQFGRILIDHVAAGGGHAHLEQHLDQIAGAFGHTVGKLADRNRFRNRNIAELLGGGAALRMAALFLFTRTLERGERTRTRPFAVIKCARDGQLARLATIIDTATTRWTRGLWTTRCGGRANGGTTERAVGFAFFNSGNGRCSTCGSGSRFGIKCCAFGLNHGDCCGGFLSLAIIVHAALFIVGGIVFLAVFAAARFFKRIHARFFGFAQQL